jgi:hypothetical protein
MQRAGLAEGHCGTNDNVIRKPIGLVTCPNCQVVMPRISLKILEDRRDLNEGVYRCPRCKTETRRWIKL